VKFARPAVLAVAVTVLLGLTACTSTPSAKTVAKDYIESIPDLTDAQRQCMLNKLDNDYTNDQLEAIGEANLTVNFDQPAASAVSTATTEFQNFVADLQECVSGSG
jgi:hypothetical protein